MKKMYPSVFIIVLDTLREDYSDEISRGLTRFGFVNYNNAVSPSPWTLPSHISLLTGAYPIIHGAHETRTKKDIEIYFNRNDLSMVPFLSSWMGYTTILLSPNIYVSPYFGLKGFDLYIDTSVPYLFNENEIKFMSELVYKTKRNKFDIFKSLLQKKKVPLLIKSMLGYSIKWIKWPTDKGATNTIHRLREVLKMSRSPIFALINLLEVHEPYVKGENSSVLRTRNRLGHTPPQDFIKKWQEHYPKQVRYLRKKLVELLKVLYETEYFDNSLIIVTSDHGQLLGEYGVIGHGTYLHDELLRVPLLIKYPEHVTVKTIEQNEEYITLVSLKQFVLSLIQSNVAVEQLLYSDTVFAESYGIPERVHPQTEAEQAYVSNLEKYRIALYRSGGKAVFNVSDWKIESIEGIDESIAKQKVIKFLESKLVSKLGGR